MVEMTRTNGLNATPKIRGVSIITMWLGGGGGGGRGVRRMTRQESEAR